LEPAQNQVEVDVDQNEVEIIQDQLEPGQNHEEDEEEDDENEMPVTEKDINEAAYRSFKKQLESLMTQKIAKKFLKLSFDEMRTQEECKEKRIGDTLKEINSKYGYFFRKPFTFCISVQIIFVLVIIINDDYQTIIFFKKSKIYINFFLTKPLPGLTLVKFTLTGRPLLVQGIDPFSKANNF
jgi:hypothetical protein